MKAVFALCSVLLIATQAGAVGDPNVGAKTGSVQETGGLFQFAVTGFDMVGMEVTVTFSDGTVDSAIWEATGPDSGHAVGSLVPGWELAIALGDSFAAPWSLSYDDAYATTRGIADPMTIEKVEIDGGTGNAVFDTDDGDFTNFNTRNSEAGETFEVISGLGFHCIDVVYTDVVALTAAEPLGDIYRRMIINFQQDGFGPGDEDLVFVADTDGLAVLDDIGPRVTIPEPVTASLALMSFAGLAMRRRRLMSL